MGGKLGSDLLERFMSEIFFKCLIAWKNGSQGDSPCGSRTRVHRQENKKWNGTVALSEWLKLYYAFLSHLVAFLFSSLGLSNRSRS